MSLEFDGTILKFPMFDILFDTSFDESERSAFNLFCPRLCSQAGNTVFSVAITYGLSGSRRYAFISESNALSDDPFSRYWSAMFVRNRIFV